jgi:hypothetical protein
LTSEQLAAVCRYPVKDAKKLEAALIKCRWLQRKGTMLHVLGWTEHNARMCANQRNGRLGGRPRKKPTQLGKSSTDDFPKVNQATSR